MTSDVYRRKGKFKTYEFYQREGEHLILLQLIISICGGNYKSEIP